MCLNVSNEDQREREGGRERENRERIIRPILSFVKLLFFFNVGP